MKARSAALAIALGLALGLGTGAATAQAHAPTFTVDPTGITLLDGATFRDNGHLNIQFDNAPTLNVHFEGKCIDRTDHECAGTRHDNAQFIGQSHFPLTLPEGTCITWVQHDQDNYHYDGPPVCNTPTDPEPEPTEPEVTPEPTPEPTEEPTQEPTPDPEPTTDTPEPTTEPTEPWTPQPSPSPSSSSSPSSSPSSSTSPANSTPSTSASPTLKANTTTTPTTPTPASSPLTPASLNSSSTSTDSSAAPELAHTGGSSGGVLLAVALLTAGALLLGWRTHRRYYS